MMSIKRTFLKAFSSTSDLMLSNFVSNSFAPPRTARTKDGGFIAELLLAVQEAVAVLTDARRKATDVLMVDFTLTTSEGDRGQVRHLVHGVDSEIRS